MVSSGGVDYSSSKVYWCCGLYWSRPHISTEVASEDITYLIFSIRICQNLGKSDSIVHVCFCACVLLCMCAFVHAHGCMCSFEFYFFPQLIDW